MDCLLDCRLMVIGARSPVDRRRRALERVNKELTRGNYETALSFVKQLKGKHGCLSAFGSAKLLPKKLDTLDMTRKTRLSELKTLIDSVYRTIRSVSSAQEEETKTSLEEDWFSVVQHESGHFLVGYLLGVLPRYYEIPNLEAIRQSVTGRVEFLGFEFLKEVGAASANQMDLSDSRGDISSKTLNNFSCVILGGMVAEELVFGYSQGYYSDVVKLNNVLQWLGFTEEEKEAHIRWAVSNTVSLLYSYSEARVSVAQAMANSKPVGACFEAIESAISNVKQ